MTDSAAGTRSLTLRNRWTLLPIIILIIVAVLIPNPIWTVLLISLGGLYLLSYAWARTLYLHIHGERVLQQGWISVGDFLSEQFLLHNHSYIPALWVELTDFSNIPGYRPSVAYEVGILTTHKWRQTSMCWQRGRFIVGPWRLRTGDPFGIFEVQIDYPLSDEMIIHPPIDTELTFALPTGLQQGSVMGRDKAIQVTSNISTVREYRPMDPLNWIHWPTTARTGSLAVREFDIEAAGDAWLLFDVEAAQHVGDGLDSTEEYGVLLASALSSRMLAQNRAVGLAAYGQEPIVNAAQKGSQQQWRILHALAILSADGDTSLELALDDAEQIIDRGSALILITPNDNPSWLPKLLQLSRKQIKTTVLLLDRSSFASEQTSNAPAIAQAIRQMGHVAQLIRSGDLKLSHSQCDPAENYKVTPLGGVTKT